MQINIEGPTGPGSDKYPLPPIHNTLIYGSSSPPLTPPEKAKKALAQMAEWLCHVHRFRQEDARLV